MCTVQHCRAISKDCEDPFFCYLSAAKEKGIYSELETCYSKEQSVKKLFTEAWGSEKMQQMIAGISKQVHRKSDTIAAQLREAGNELYKAKKIDEALAKYNESLCMAEHRKGGDSPELYRAYANRCAILFLTHRFQLCIDDIDRAIASGGTKQAHLKLLERKAKCQAMLQKKTAVQKTLKDMRVIEKENKMEPVLSEKSLAAYVSNTERKGLCPLGKKFSYIFDFKTTELPVMENPHPYEPSHADCVRLGYNKHNGKHLVAERNILPGEIISIQKAATVVPITQMRHFICTFCCCRAKTPLPCPKCTSVVFCSTNCLEQANRKFHYAECYLLGLWNGYSGRLSIRSFSHFKFYDLKRRITTCKKFDVDSEAEFGVFSPELVDPNYEGLPFIRNKVRRCVQHMVDCCILACIITKVFAASRSFFKDASGAYKAPDNEDLLLLGCTILRQELCKTIGVAEVEIEPLTFSCVGEGIFPTFIDFYSCVGNTFLIGYGNHLVQRAADFIREEEVLTFTSEGFMHCPREARQANLASLGITCECTACTDNWPTYDNLAPELVLRCLCCSSPVTSSELNCTDCEEGASEDATRQNKVCLSTIRALISDVEDVLAKVVILEPSSTLAPRLINLCSLLKQRVMHPNKHHLNALLAVGLMHLKHEGSVARKKCDISLLDLGKALEKAEVETRS